MEGRAHILSILGALSVQGSVMSVLAPRGVTQACGSSGLVGIGIGPESAWLDKKGGRGDMGHTTVRGSPVSISVLRPERQHLQRDEEL